MSEREVSRLAQDLRSGNAQDAVNVIRQELQNHPQIALQELRQANAMAGPNARLHLGQKSDGDVALVDNSGRTVARIDVQQQQQQQYSNNWNTQGRYQDNSWNNQGRYQDNSWSNQGRYQDQYYNGANGRPQDMSYLNGNRYDGYQNGRDNFYGQNQNQVGRLAQDLARGDARDAVRAVQDILRCSDDPSRAINEANRLADQMARRMGYRSAMEHIANTRDGSGNLAVVDQYGRQIARIDSYDNRNNNGWNNNNYDRYSTYPNNNSYYRNNDSYYQNNSSYYDGRPSYAPNQNNSRYGNGYYNGNYNGSYNNNNYDSYYGNNHNRLNGGQAAAAIGIGIVGGLILSNIGKHNNNNNFHRGRW